MRASLVRASICPEDGLDLREGFFYGIEVRRVGRQVDELNSPLPFRCGALWGVVGLSDRRVRAALDKGPPGAICFQVDQALPTSTSTSTGTRKGSPSERSPFMTSSIASIMAARSHLPAFPASAS